MGVVARDSETVTVGDSMGAIGVEEPLIMSSRLGDRTGVVK